MRRLSVCLLLLGLMAGSLRAEDWPGWRGPRGDGTSTEKGIPTRFSPSNQVRWKVELPGSGYSSPIVVGDRIFVTTCLEESGDRVLLCLDRKTGKTLWSRTVLTAPLEGKHPLNSFASATPATDGERVYVAFLALPRMQAACYDLEGKLLWQTSPGKLLSRHGFCTSPVLHKELVILNGDQDPHKDHPEARAYLVALDRKTGKEVWRVNRPNHTRSYCTPILVPCPKRPGVTQLVLSGSKCVTGYDADTGKLLWIIDGPTEQYVASLVLHQNILFLTTGFPEYHLMGIRPTGEGNITRSQHIAWHIPHKDNGQRGASYVPSPLAHNGHFFVVSDAGYLGCIEAQSGKRLWLKKLGRRHSASPILLEGNLIIPDDDGKVWVVKASPEFEIVATNEMQEAIYASPATADGCLFLRGVKHLYCIGK
ncbi:MAG: PQQ-binding-like beta-propeller repeat protein [Gemmataceae bacterium]